MVFKKSECRN